MSKKNGYSRVEKDWLGNEYMQHYDEDHNKTGTSVEEKDWLGTPYIQHYDVNGNKDGRSAYQKDWLGNEYMQHQNREGDNIGTSREEKDWLGNEQVVHEDEQGRRLGESREEQGWLGDSYTQHERRGSSWMDDVQRGANVGAKFGRMISGSGSDDSTELIVKLVIGLLAIGAVIALVMFVLYIAVMILGIAALLAPPVALGLYFFRKPQEIKWLYWAGGISLLFCLGLYVFQLHEQLHTDGVELIPKVVYTGILGTVGFLLLEPVLAKKYPYEEEGGIFQRKKSRNILLGSGLGALALTLFLSSSWGTISAISTRNAGTITSSSSTSSSSSNSNTPSSSSHSLGSSSSSEVGSSLIVEGSAPAWSKVDELRVRENPGLDSRVLDGVNENEQLEYLGVRTGETHTTTLRGQRITAPWCQVRTSRNITGWVFGGGLRFEGEKGLASPRYPGQYPHVSQRHLTTEELANYDKQSLRLMRNEVFARYGYLFKSAELRQHFSQFDWYNPRYKNVDAKLSEIEKANVQLILKVEKGK